MAMRAPFSFVLAGMWLAQIALSPAQMSTFPSPPPLAPPSDQGQDATRSGSATAPNPDDSASSAERKSIDSPDAALTNATPNPVAPTVTAATLSSMAALDDKVALEAGDTVSFRVIEDRDQAVSRVVTDTGEVDFPYIGRVKVEGKTCHEVAVEVKKLLEVDYYKQATVIVGLDLIIGEDKTKAKDMAWVVGQVRDVGPQELSKVQPLTVSQAIMRAGGFGDFADQRKVKLIHRGAPVADNGNGPPANLGSAKDFQVIDVKSVFDGKSVVDPVLKAGDYVIVPKQFVNF
jgi:protein involved in polysaccharide export with SLBB domain